MIFVDALLWSDGKGWERTMIKERNKTDYNRAEYIQDMTGSLAEIARREGLGMLAYLLDMAKLEAQRHLAPDGDRTEANSGTGTGTSPH